MPAALLVSVLLIAACGLIYELVASSLATYLLGDSVTQFSTVIGTYLFAMGIGSWLSRYVTRGVVSRFVAVELLVGLIGGLSSTVLYFTFAYTDAFQLVLYGLVLLIGILAGLEIPLLMRILRERFEFKDVIANVLSVDYLGALAASLLFPIVLVPQLGLMRAALFFGIINVVVALWTTHLFRDALGALRQLQAACLLALLVLGGTFAGAKRLTAMAEENIYADEIVLARDSRFQRIVLTAWKDDLRLFLNGHLQFSSRDEYRYHEALVHPGLSALPHARRVLVLGGGDGMAVREVLKHPNVERVTLVDLDPVMTGLFTTHATLAALNDRALSSPRVEVINADAFVWLDQMHEPYDFVVVDFPDPSNYGVGKLYTTAFYRLLARHVARGGHLVVQSTSPMFARQSFWSIVATLRAVGLQTYPYHLYVPSFGEWGFVLAGTADYALPATLPQGLRYLTPEVLPSLFDFPADMQPVSAQPNRLDDQALVRYYEREWAAINR